MAAAGAPDAVATRPNLARRQLPFQQRTGMDYAVSGLLETGATRTKMKKPAQGGFFYHYHLSAQAQAFIAVVNVSAIIGN